MQEERIMVLKMLEDGKINVEDAMNLLDSLNANHKSCEKKSGGIEDKIKKLSKCVDSIAKDLGDKVGSAYKNMEPKVKKTTQCVVQKTAEVMQQLSNKLSETSDKLDANDENN